MPADLLDRLAAYRPTPAILDAEWNPPARAARRTELLEATAATGEQQTLRFAPARRPSRRLALVGSGGLVVAAGAAIAITVAVSGGRHDTPGPVPNGGQQTLAGVPDVGAHEYGYRATTSYSVTATGAKITQRSRDWIAPDGTIWSIRTSGAPGCYRFAPSDPASLETPSAALVAKLPTDPDRLDKYLRAAVSGSTSRDEAVFVAVGDLLRDGDGLASPKLRAALVSVLGKTAGTTVHPDALDYLGRPAIRVDFVDQQRRPGELQSLYFDPHTYRLVEERGGSDGQSSAAASASAPYGGAISPGSTPDNLTGPATVSVTTVEQVVSAPPQLPKQCRGWSD